MRSLESLVTKKWSLVTAGVVLVAVTIAYSNHFHNSFQFDDAHAITDNPYIRTLGNIPRFFTDATTQSVYSRGATWRPIVAISLAVDYWLGGGLNDTFYFHLSTFVWFLAQLLLMYMLFARLLDLAQPDPRNPWIAWFAVAWYGLHPAIAETVNYIIQRADLLSTLAVVAALVVWARFPEHRKRGLYLIPFVLGVLAKAPALIFPFILLSYVFFFEEKPSFRGFWGAARKAFPALAVMLALAWISSAMTSKTWNPTNRPADVYLITQPYVVVRYFASFFLPIHLSADSNLQPFPSIYHLEVLGGFLFLAALIYAIYKTAKRPRTRPISFGLVWFLLGLAPTSLYPLADLENDHRLFLPFVGLTLAVTCAGSLIPLRRPLRGLLRWGVAAGLVCVLSAYAVGTHQRNRVWRTEESLWRDVTIKSPNNGRGFGNFADTLIARGAYREAVPYLERALTLQPDMPAAEADLGTALGNLNQDALAEQHFRRALQIDPQLPPPYYFYAKWLKSKARHEEALGVANMGLSVSPALMDLRYLVLDIYVEHGLWSLVKSFGEESLKVAPGDPVVLKDLSMEREIAKQVAVVEAQVRSHPSPEKYLELSVSYHQLGRYQDCIRTATEALRLRPGFAEAYNTIAAAYLSMSQWDQAIQAASEALRLKPDFQLAQKNLEFARSQKSSAGAR